MEEKEILESNNTDFYEEFEKYETESFNDLMELAKEFSCDVPKTIDGKLIFKDI